MVYLPAMPPHWPRWVLSCGLLIALALTTQLWLSGRFDWGRAMVIAATDTFPWFAALPLVVWFSGRFPLDETRRWRNGLFHLVAGLMLSVLLPLAALGLWRVAGMNPMPGARPPPWLATQRPTGINGTALAPTAGERMPPPPQDFRRPPALWRMAVSRAPFHWPLYALVLMAVHGWRANQRGRARERRAAELERLLAEARLTGLSRQLHPHFLFNTLNMIVEFVRSDPVRAEDMLLDLSDLLRHALRAADRHVVPLAEELALLDLYLGIQRARFGDRLRIERQIESGALAAGVPVMLLQPLLENALRHGLDESDATVTVTLAAWVEHDRLILAVRDDARGGGTDSAGEGIGLANIRQRLTALYGGDFRFDNGPCRGGGYAVGFTLPVQPRNIPALSP